MEDFYCKDVIKFKGTSYRIGDILILSGAIEFYEIREIFILKDKTTVFILCVKIMTDRFSTHFQAYPVQYQSFEFLNLKKFSSPPLHICKTAKGNLMLRPKQLYKHH